MVLASCSPFTAELQLAEGERAPGVTQLCSWAHVLAKDMLIEEGKKGH